jgi:hypothetical protein
VLQAQADIRSNDDVDLITLLQSRLTQAIGRESDRQAVSPSADCLREVLAGVSRAILRPGLSQGAPSAVHGHL